MTQLTRKRHLRTLLAILAMLALLAACGGADPAADSPVADAADDEPADEEAESEEPAGEEAAGEPDRVRFAPTAPLPGYWPYYYIAEPLGYYEEENIDFEAVNARGAVQQAVMEGQLDFSGTGLDYIVQAPEFDPSPKWYMNVDRYLWIMVTLADSGVESVEDLQGRKIGINEPHDSLDADFMMGVAGIEDYELVPVGEDFAAVVAMQRGEVDAFVTAGAVSLVAIEEEFPDLEFQVIDNPVAASYYNTGIMGTVPSLEDDPDLAVRFARAVAKAWVFQYENPEAAGELLYEVAPESAEDAEQAARFVEAGNEMHRESFENQGRMDLELYQDMIDTHVELGLLEEGYDAETIITNDLIDQIWDFDREAIEEEARNYGQ